MGEREKKGVGQILKEVSRALVIPLGLIANARLVIWMEKVLPTLLKK
jgi:hypothetical protein